MKLYKYQAINEYTLDNLKNNQIYFNNAGSFNDPYEGNFNFKIENDGAKEKLIKLVTKINDTEYQEKIASKGSSEIENAIKFIEQEYVNDFLKGNIRISCFSSINDSVLMWAHYSNNHKGICVEYNFKSEGFNDVHEVKYIPDVYTLLLSDDDLKNPESLQKRGYELIVNKYNIWSYEHEYRIFSDSVTENYCDNEISAIYFGIETSLDDVFKIMRLLKANDHIKYYKSDLEFDSYNMRFIPIKPELR